MTTMAQVTVTGATVGAVTEAAAAPGAAPQSASTVRRHELAAFLRHRREHITPEQVGLPRGTRRRTPGLRREEVAQLAAVGVTWYTWLEQARDIQVSVQVLDALARTLFLDSSERSHLFQLAGAVDPQPTTSCAVVTPALQAMLDQLDPIPACLQNSRYDILAYNRTYGMLLCDLDAVPPEDRNCLILSYTHEEWRSAIVHLEKTQRLMAARFRGSMADHLADPAWKTLLKRLRTSPEFCEVWDRHEVMGASPRRKEFRNSHVGRITVDHTDLWLGPSRGPRMVTYAPADEESRERMEKLYKLAQAK
ncbi:helix-turn-helix transcriptional regulator [Streptomyces sp. NPDC059272]|uniref:helix-turn-helix transcriptional regulator n=1 Tax=Streptomyces sp. NPDC059272 TaxID=3346800 RepID=UPI0036B1062C